MDLGSRKRSSISQPRTKRQRLSAEPSADDASTSHQSISNTNWLRIYSWNINGISPFLQSSMTSFIKSSKSSRTGGIESSLRGFLQRHHWPHILNLQEVKISPLDESTRRSVERAVNIGHGRNDDGPSYTVRFCLPKDNFNARGFGGKVYGVATIVRDDFFECQVQSIREVDWDLEGRVLITETKSKLCILNIYAVNGTTNVYRDPLTGTPTGTRHDRKLLFHKHLLEECKHLEHEGYQLILSGDLNVAPARIDGHPNLRTFPEQHQKNRADFHEKFLDAAVPSSLAAIDSFRYLHPETKRYTYIPRNVPWGTSCDRVDLILLSKSLVTGGFLMDADILMTEADRGPSDHVPLFVSLDICAADEDDGGLGR